MKYWEVVLPDSLNAVRSLLCTATNATPHERLFSFHRRSTIGTTLPQWLLAGGRVLMKKQTRSSKYDPVAHEVDLLECNPQYAHVRLPNGREETVSIKHLAPPGESGMSDSIAEFGESYPSSGDPPSDSRCIDPISDPLKTVDVPDSDLQTNYDILKQHQQRLHSYNLRSREI